MAAAASLRRCALPAAAALAAQQQHARTEGSALLQWRSSRVAPQSVDGRPVADVREALAGLGYGDNEIRDTLRELPSSDDAAALLRDALKSLGARRA